MKTYIVTITEIYKSEVEAKNEEDAEEVALELNAQGNSTFVSLDTEIEEAEEPNP